MKNPPLEPDFEKTEKNVLPRLEKGFELFTQSSREYLEPNFIALNNRFPNMVGFGIVQVLKQLMAQEKSGKLVWTEAKIPTYASLMNTDESLLVEVVTFLTKNLKEFKLINAWRTSPEIGWVQEKIKVLYYPKLMNHLIDLQVQRKNEQTLYYQQYSSNRNDGRETYQAKRRRMVADLEEVLVLTKEETDKMKESIKKYYAGIEFETAWKEFCDMVKSKYLEWHGQLVPENKEQTFYVYLNNIQ